MLKRKQLQTYLANHVQTEELPIKVPPILRMKMQLNSQILVFNRDVLLDTGYLIPFPDPIIGREAAVDLLQADFFTRTSEPRLEDDPIGPPSFNLRLTALFILDGFTGYKGFFWRGDVGLPEDIISLSLVLSSLILAVKLEEDTMVKRKIQRISVLYGFPLGLYRQREREILTFFKHKPPQTHDLWWIYTLLGPAWSEALIWQAGCQGFLATKRGQKITLLAVFVLRSGRR